MSSDPGSRPPPPLRLGALCWNQYTDWPAFLEAGRRADRLGYDTLWTWDHLYPIVGSSRGPIFEGWMTLAAWAQATERVRIGLMVDANTFREPALVAKMVTALDHISGGRAILGIGAAWFEEEHAAFGIPFGSGAPECLRWLREALPVFQGMLRGAAPTAAGARYHARAVRNDPPLAQSRLPILIAPSATDRLRRTAGPVTRPVLPGKVNHMAATSEGGGRAPAPGGDLRRPRRLWVSRSPGKVVARYADGTVLKGYADFDPDRPCFRLVPIETPDGEGIEIQVKDLKAVFIVRSFAGNPEYCESKDLYQTRPPGTRKVRVEFVDGEELVGYTRTMTHPTAPGFFFTPLDPQGNNLRVFAVLDAVSRVSRLL